MIEFRKYINKNNFSELLIIFLFSLILVIPPFLYGGRDIRAKVLIFGLIFPLTWFVWKIKGKFEFKEAKLLFILLGIFILEAGISIIWTPEKYLGLETLFIFIFCFILLFLTFNFIGSKKWVIYFAYLVIGLGVILSLKGLEIFVQYSNSSARLGSTFNHHLPFGEFLSYPLFLGLFLLVLKPMKLQVKILLIIINSLFFITFFFNLCRGAWLSFLFISFLLLVFFHKYILKKEFIISFLIIIFISSAGIYYFEQIKSLETGDFLKQASYGKETIKENAVSARIYFWRNALKIFKDKPFLGGGLESFKTLHKQYMPPPFYYSAYPHNFYLKVLAELGIIGFLIFSAFIITIIYYSFQVFKKIKSGLKNNYPLNQNNLILIGMIAGIASAMANNFINPGWAFSPANLIIFFFFSGIILKTYALSKKENSEIKIKPVFTAFLLTLSLILFIMAPIILFSDFYFQKGERRIKRGENEDAFYYFNKATKINPVNPEYNGFLSATYLSMAEKNPQNEQNNIFFPKAEYYIKKALKFGHETDDLLLLARIYSSWGKNDLSEEILKKAVGSNPSRFIAYLELSSLYLKQNRFSEIHSLLNWVLSNYKKEYIFSPLYIVENKETELFKIASLHNINGEAYLKEGKIEEAKKEFEKAQYYYSND